MTATARKSELMFEQRMLIDGNLVEAEGGRTFDNVNPATEEVMGDVADGSRADMERAVAAARTVPVSVFRCGMILADTKYLGQLNVPDTFTRLMLSLLATGIAPRSFYPLDDDGERQRAHYDGLPVDFIAEAVATLGDRLVDGFQTYHVMNPYDDGIGLDQYVDWLIEAGYPIERIPEYDEWFRRFETVIRGLPERQRQASLLPLLAAYEHPSPPVRGAMAPTDRFRSAVQAAKVGEDKDIPHINAHIIVKYATDLEVLGLLRRDDSSTETSTTENGNS